MKFVARCYHTDLLIGEWGFFKGARDTLKLSRFAQCEDRYMIGSTWWQWSQACGDPHSISWKDNKWQAQDHSMHLVELDRQGNRTGRVNEPVLHILNRTRPLAVAGRVKGFTSNPNTGELLLKGHTRYPGVVSIYIPARFGMPVLDGSNADITHTETVSGGLRADISVNGRYRVHILGK